ncbi:hypothetical protein BN2497_7165 [Janthinobacterium sp. CG23_2]|nr:hypothetical protein BN2497_7165 [Janthinobacterium sp. CG23_2]CUU29980.1 hypothetical protein BN3177_7165 [Janthinobacterium sp. CG23_2]
MRPSRAGMRAADHVMTVPADRRRHDDYTDAHASMAAAQDR